MQRHPTYNTKEIFERPHTSCLCEGGCEGPAIKGNAIFREGVCLSGHDSEGELDCLLENSFAWRRQTVTPSSDITELIPNTFVPRWLLVLDLKAVLTHFLILTIHHLIHIVNHKQPCVYDTLYSLVSKNNTDTVITQHSQRMIGEWRTSTLGSPCLETLPPPLPFLSRSESLKTTTF